MAPRKVAPPLAGPECPGCRALAADLVRLQRQQRKQAAELRELDRVLIVKSEAISQANKEIAGWQNWAADARKFLAELRAKHLAEIEQQRREILELRQLLKARTVAVPQMPDGTTTLYPN